MLALNIGVSIQLVSPASGDMKKLALLTGSIIAVSIQLVSPASGDIYKKPEEYGYATSSRPSVSIQLVSPASGDTFLRVLLRVSAR